MTTRWLLRALPALTFLVGLVLGGLIIGLTSGGGDGDDQPEGGAAASGAPSSGATPGTSIVIPAACSEASDAVNKAVGLLRTGVRSVRDFQPKVLVQVLDDLETLDPRLRELADQCSAVEVSPATSPITGSPSSTGPSR